MQGVVNGLWKIKGLAKLWSNFTGLAVSFFAQFWKSRSLKFFAKPMWGLNLRLAREKSLGLAEKNAGLAVSQSLAFTIRHPLYKRNK